MEQNTLLKIRLVQSTYRLNSKAKTGLATVPMKGSYKIYRDKHGDKMRDKTFDTELKCLY